MPELQDYVIGLDFDNTLVSYDALMHLAAAELGFIQKNQVAPKKKDVRHYIRRLPDGEIKWQVLQAEVYGKRMSQARLMDGAEAFLRACRDEGIEPCIISHKSKFATQDKEQIDMQETALKWMQKNRFFEKEGLGLREDQVHFEISRAEKISRIKQLGCTHFVDDLIETLADEDFPKDAVKILFSPDEERISDKSIKLMRSWGEIHEYFFGKDTVSGVNKKVRLNHRSSKRS